MSNASGLPQTSSDDEIAMEKPHLTHTISSGAVTISPELFEKLYLTPKTPHKGANIKRFANPTPMGFMGFVISTMTLSMVLMGWGGANGLYSIVGIFFFVGPVLLLLTTIFEWIMGNFFSMMVCGFFTVFWLSVGVLYLPTLGLAAAYSPTGNAAEGAASVEYNAAIALFLLVWAFALFTFFIFSLKINLIFATIFLLVTIAIFIISAGYWKVSQGNYVTAGHLQKAGAAILFVVGLLGWYQTFVMMAAEMRLPISLPVGDLSHFWPSTDVEMAVTEANH